MCFRDYVPNEGALPPVVWVFEASGQASVKDEEPWRVKFEEPMRQSVRGEKPGSWSLMDSG